MENIWIQLIVTIGSILAGMFLTIRYSISQGNKREKALLEYMEKMQNNQLEYYTNKNGHIERIAKSFTTTSNKMSKAISKLTTKIEVHNK